LAATRNFRSSGQNWLCRESVREFGFVTSEDVTWSALGFHCLVGVISDSIAESDAGRRANLITRRRSSKSGMLRTIAIPLAAALVFVVQITAACVPRAGAASGLKLSPNLSCDDDSSPNYPIQGDNLSEGSIASGEATVIFFGTSNCWNTSREAERLVKLYPQFRNRIHFVIVDLNNVAPEQQGWVSQYYHGYIPTITAIDSKGTVIYDRAGETASTRGDTSNLQRLLDSLH
jgi:hypothetical protein